MRKMCVCYNICGISGNERVEWYIECLTSLLNQKFDDFEIVVSSCLNNILSREALIKEFGGKISYNWIDEKLPVNVTFNHSVLKAVEQFREFEGYLYVDSGVTFDDKTYLLEKLYDTQQSGPYGMVTILADNDNATSENLGQAYFQDNFIIPLGKAINCHTTLFSNKIFQTYRRLIPDIFASFCTESTFPYINASVKQNWLILGGEVVRHFKGVDGASSGFYPHNVVPHWHLFRSRRPMQEILADPMARESGFGYEECNGIFPHDPSKYDSNGWTLDNKLENFIRDNIYLGEDTMNYSTIQHEWVPCVK